jgi:hypothetical protein
MKTKIPHFLLFLLCLLFARPAFPRAHGATAAPRRIFGVYVYDSMGHGTIPSGWHNQAQRGCDPITNATRRQDAVAFLCDPANAVAVAKLSCNPLLKNNATYFPVYVDMVKQLSAAGVAVHLMVSDTPDSFLTYQSAFHAAVDALSEAVPAARIGISYDVEGAVSGSAKLWSETYAIMIDYAERSAARRPSTWGGFTFWGTKNAGVALYQHANAIEWGKYFAGDLDSINVALKDIVGFNDTARLSLGLELGTEKGIGCATFAECTGSLMWGRGVDSTKQATLADWVAQVLLPRVEALGFPQGRLSDEAPFYVESLAGYMAFQRNIQARRLPCTSCTKSEQNEAQFWCRAV